MKKRILVTGAGGFIGNHLVNYLKTIMKQDCYIKGVDLKRPEWEGTKADEFLILDLRREQSCRMAVIGVDEVYHLAANMGGIGFIETHKSEIVHDNILINMNMLEASKKTTKKFLFSSSACIYPSFLQNKTDAVPLKETDAYPADPEDGYGWEKLYTERACRHYMEDYGLKTYIVRFHNIYGELGTYIGGREKSPAAICRKIALAPNNGEIDIWGDGTQTRSYCYISDCVEAIYRVMNGEYHKPLNIGTDRLVSINELVDIIAKIAGKNITKRYDLTKPQGVKGRNSDNTLAKKILDWEPKVTLEEGLERTYRWIQSSLVKK